MDSPIFRKVSLERLSSPDQLDVLLKVTSPLGWLSLLSVGLLLAVALFWGFFGNIPTTVPGNGILVKTGGVLDVEAPAGGQVTAIYVGVGNVVSRGQLLARVAQPKLLSDVNRDKAQLRELKKEYEKTAHFNTRDLKEKLDHYSKQRTDYQHSIQLAREQLNWAGEKLANQEKLFEDRLIRKQDYLATKKEIFSIQDNVEKTQRDLKQLSIDEAELKQKQEMDLLSRKQEIDKLQMQIEAEEADLELNSQIVSPYSGAVVEVIAMEGALVNGGDKILTLELVGDAVKDLVAILYVSAEGGKRIKPGMKVDISPATVKREEWGCMLGMVTGVSPFPATQQRMLRNLQNQKLVDSFCAGGAPIEVSIDLIPDPKTSSGYKWSSPKGPPVTVEHGTICSATIAVEEQPPVSMVIPLFKKKVLGIGLGTK